MTSEQRLDLIDRKIITAEDQELTCHPDKPMTKYEAEVLDMAFGKRKTVKIEDLFSDYRFDDDLVDSYKKKYKGHTLEAKLNKLGDDFNDRYLGKLEKITSLVDKEISQKALPAIREDLSDEAVEIAKVPVIEGFINLTRDELTQFIKEFTSFFVLKKPGLTRTTPVLSVP